ncbi:type IV secretion system protein VirB10 [Vibrio scophthalmi]|uniref:Channel protein VirB10 n=1 Tax=Vibrio scophthalmi LMG 19158 TaxID=870967 RepID=F9RQN2_9VIBR|nr:type IV secretion system protein VirB10 [Vibrio scophthalmi]EGU33963.1 channel protein VirB10 [Vibrio scophthalmi LMG 19158]
MTDEFDGEALLDASTSKKTPPDKKKVAFFLIACLMLVGVAGAWIFWGDNDPEPEKVEASNRTSTTAQSTATKDQQGRRSFQFTDKPQTPTNPVKAKTFDTSEPTDIEEIKQQAYLEAKAELEAEQEADNQSEKVGAVDGGQGANGEHQIVKTRTLDKSSKPQGGSSGGGESLGITPNIQNPFQQSPQTTPAFNVFAEDNKPQTQGALGGKLSGSKNPSAVAAILYNRDFLLAKGAFIDCVLNTSMDSTVAGMTKCTLTRDIYSDNGSTLLLERGSEITGEYRANLSQGQSRLFVLWDRIKTPHGVVVNLDSPATDSLGAAGVSGYVETHFWARFGGAMMLSLVDDLAAYIATNGGESVNNFENSSDAAQTMAAKALEATINIPPTFYKNQGERVGIFIARDIDFSTVYQLRETQ